MSILLKGLKMPEGDNAVVVVIHSNGTVDRPNWQWDCTLIKGAEAISIPDHGNLIDKDVLLQHVVEIIPQKVFDFVPVVIPAERSEE